MTSFNQFVSFCCLGVYKSKTRDPSSQHSVDGCAIYWRIDRFAMHEQYGIEFDEAAKLTFADKRQLRRAMKGNIALVVMLEELQSIQKTHHKRPRKRKLCIANCHLHWDPQYSEVKLVSQIFHLSAVTLLHSYKFYHYLELK